MYTHKSIIVSIYTFSYLSRVNPSSESGSTCRDRYVNMYSKYKYVYVYICIYICVYRLVCVCVPSCSWRVPARVRAIGIYMYTCVCIHLSQVQLCIYICVYMCVPCCFWTAYRDRYVYMYRTYKYLYICLYVNLVLLGACTLARSQ